MSFEDMQRFEVDSYGNTYMDGTVLLRCTHCAWLAEYDEPLTLAELVQRADEHTEVCR